MILKLARTRPRSSGARSLADATMSLSPLRNRLRTVIARAMSDGVPARSLYVALVVGTILNLINQGDAVLAPAGVNWLKVALTYCVPYAVSTYGAVSYALTREYDVQRLSADGIERRSG